MVSSVPASPEREAAWKAAHWWFHAGGVLAKIMAAGLPAYADVIFHAMQKAGVNPDDADDEHRALFALWWSEQQRGEPL